MLNNEMYLKIKKNWDNLAKPLDALGVFEDILSRMGAVLSDQSIDISPAALVVFIADNGIIAQGVSQSGVEVTSNVAKALGKGKSSVCHMARQAGVDVFPVNIGMKEVFTDIGVDNSYCVSKGTRDFSIEAAMTTDETMRAIDAGKSIAVNLKEKGYRTFILGEMGIGNTTTSTAVISALMGIDAADICGRGAGLSDKGLDRKITIINQAINKYNLYKADPLTVLSTVGGFDIAAMVGIIEKAYEIGIPVILDGLITAAAALVATGIQEKLSDVLIFSHKGREKGIEIVAKKMGMVPVIDGNMALGEGTGGVMFYSCLKNALSLYQGNTLFEDMNIEKYERFS